MISLRTLIDTVLDHGCWCPGTATGAAGEEWRTGEVGHDPRSVGTSIDTVPVPPEVLWAALRGSAEGAAALGMHLVLEHGAPITDAARLPESFATVLAWVWRWNQRSALELLATYLGELRDVLDDPDVPAEQRFRLEDALGSVASALSAENLLGDQGSDQLAAWARAELPKLDVRLRGW